MILETVSIDNDLLCQANSLNSDLHHVTLALRTKEWSDSIHTYISADRINLDTVHIHSNHANSLYEAESCAKG